MERRVPYILKQFIDVVSQPGMVFGFDPRPGYTGLLTGRKAAVIYTSAVYGPGRGPAFGADFQAPYFEDWLRWAGINDVRDRLPAQPRHRRRRDRPPRRPRPGRPGRPRVPLPGRACPVGGMTLAAAGGRAIDPDLRLALVLGRSLRRESARGQRSIIACMAAG